MGGGLATTLCGETVAFTVHFIAFVNTKLLRKVIAQIPEQRLNLSRS